MESRVLNFVYAKCILIGCRVIWVGLAGYSAVTLYLKYRDTVEPSFNKALFSEVLEWFY